MTSRDWTYRDEKALGGIIDNDVWKMQKSLDQAFPGVFTRRFLDGVKSDLFSKFMDMIRTTRSIQASNTTSLKKLAAELEHISKELEMGE